MSWPGWENYVPLKAGDTVVVKVPVGMEPKPPKPSKYHAQPCEVDGVRFDSKKEAARYGELKLRGLAGQLWDLELQPRFDLYVSGVHVGCYRGDFAYSTLAGRVTEDVKGIKTPVYRLKKRMVEAQYLIRIIEV